MLFQSVPILCILLLSLVVCSAFEFPSDTPTRSLSQTPSTSHSRTATRSASPSLSTTRSASSTHSSTRSPTPTRTPTKSNSLSNTPSHSPTISHTSSISHSPSETASPSTTPSVSPCPACPTVSPCPGGSISSYEDIVRQVYTNLIYPTSTMILAGQLSVTNLFGPNVVGRVDPVGTFDNFQLLTEYFYALAANPANFISSVDFIDLFGVGNEVYVRVNVFFQAVNPNTTLSFNLSQSGRYVFGDDGLISTVDVIIHYLGKRSNPVTNRPVYTAAQNALIQGVCYGLVVTPGSCANPALDPTGHYANLTDCITFMTGINYGTWDDAQADSFVCRQLHTLLTFFDPVTHCPHTGKTGGGKCVDWDYVDYFAESYRKKK